MTKTFAQLVALITLFSNLVYSQNIEKRLQRQEKRIDQGVRNGSLTAEEAQVLKENQKKIQQMYIDAKQDEKLSKQEKKKIRNELNKESKLIYRKKHNIQSEASKPKVQTGLDHFLANVKRENLAKQVRQKIKEKAMMEIDKAHFVNVSAGFEGRLSMPSDLSGNFGAR